MSLMGVHDPYKCDKIDRLEISSNDELTLNA